MTKRYSNISFEAEREMHEDSLFINSRRNIINEYLEEVIDK